MTTATAVTAASRFGMGPKPGELAAIAGDPRGWLRAQIGQWQPLPPALAQVPPAAGRLAALLEARADGAEQIERMLRREGRDAFVDDAAARTLAALDSPAPFIERLVHFWSNHFTVSIARPAVIPIAVPFEVEAIRPYVTGRFVDMLTAVIGHPGMLVYLDNAQSVGPNSRAGRRAERGLNENLARELLELHTVGVDGGYGQDDVIALAKILTGWSVARPRDDRAGSFLFRPNIHEPGDKMLLGQRYREDGQAEGFAALAALTAHPATARHVATKLARHFVADQPPAAAVDRLAQVFAASGGDLAEVAAVLIALDAAWSEPLAKARDPNDLVIAALRATGARPEPLALVGSLRLLGQTPLAAPSPAGWPDTAADWITPEALMLRVDWAREAGERLAVYVDPRRLMEDTIGPVASEQTRFLVNGAPSVAEGIALVLASPEFQRR